MKRFGIALSGGGHRASLFGLGVMLYLGDAERLAAAASISSVSGGSITNGYLSQLPQLRSLKHAEFQQACWPLARALAVTGTLWAWWGTWVYLLVTVTLLVASVLWPWLIGGQWVLEWDPRFLSAVRVILAVLSAALVWQFVVARRGIICRWALQAALFKDRQGKPTSLNDIARPDHEHVICATELHAGEHIYFSGRFIYSARLGCGAPAGLSLAHAVQASAGFPGGFMPTYLRAQPLQFRGGEESCTWLALLDGGLYDNMADQWQFGLRERKARDDFPDEFAHDCEELIVVNASGNMPWSSVASLSIPIAGEIFSLLRTMNVLFDNTTTTRRRYLVDKFSRNSDFGGVVITLEQSPTRIPAAFAEAADPDDAGQQAQAERAHAMLAELQAAAAVTESPDFWKNLVDQNKGFPTTLRALGVERSARLILQAYVTAMSNLHVILGYPLLRLPTLADIERYLVTGDSF